MPTIKIKKPNVFTNAIKYIAETKADSLEIQLKSDDSLAMWQDTDGNTLLHFAAFYASTKCFELLLEYHADLYARNQWGEEPLHMAIFQPNAETMLGALHKVIKDQRLKSIDKAAARLHPLTLHALALDGNEKELDEKLKLLLPDAKAIKAYWHDGAGFTPLHYAAALGYTRFFVTLCQHLNGLGADLTAFTGTNHRGQTPLHLAALHGHQDIMYYCLGEPALVHPDEENVFQLEQACCFMGDADKTGNTVWHYLVASQGVEALAGLFEKVLHFDKLDGAIASLYKANHQGLMPLHLAIVLGNVDVFSSLFKAYEKQLYFKFLKYYQHNFEHVAPQELDQFILNMVARSYPTILALWLKDTDKAPLKIIFCAKSA